MRLENYPNNPRYVGTFYAQSVSLVEYLANQKGPQRVHALPARLVEIWRGEGASNGTTVSKALLNWRTAGTEHVPRAKGRG